YALARRIDDVGDGDLPPTEKMRQLGALRSAIADSSPSDPVLVAVRDAAGRHPIPFGAFSELIDGGGRHVVGVSFEPFDELVDYCRCVAGSVGRLCLAVFGSRDPVRGPTYANSLGIALQQTNILRDIREDLSNGRVYLPAEDLARFGVTLRLDSYGSL